MDEVDRLGLLPYTAPSFAALLPSIQPRTVAATFCRDWATTPTGHATLRRYERSSAIETAVVEAAWSKWTEPTSLWKAEPALMQTIQHCLDGVEEDDLAEQTDRRFNTTDVVGNRLLGTATLLLAMTEPRSQPDPQRTSLFRRIVEERRALDADCCTVHMSMAYLSHRNPWGEDALHIASRIPNRPLQCLAVRTLQEQLLVPLSKRAQTTEDSSKVVAWCNSRLR